tara:strand:- start:66 stop:290 length:225 start_codon:yes stop_codon:yes gene_type:complete
MGGIYIVYFSGSITIFALLDNPSFMHYSIGNIRIIIFQESITMTFVAYHNMISFWVLSFWDCVMPMYLIVNLGD